MDQAADVMHPKEAQAALLGIDEVVQFVDTN